MNAPGRLAAFAAAVAVVSGGAAIAGAAIDPERSEEQPMNASHNSNNSHAGAATVEDAPQPVRGLAVADEGLRVVLEDPEVRRGRTETLSFRIVDERERTVRDFDVGHEKRMHLIVARRDLTGFQHLHPEQAADGTWSTDVRLDEAGSYRVFADFSHEDEPRTLAADLRVDGSADLKPLPPARPTAVSDGGYDVRLDAGHARPGEEAELRFSISKDGAAIEPEPYLGAGGHLVALRDGDMAFLHVHPTGDGTEFAATFPTPGSYRLFLQFKHEGRVQTVAFTQEVR